MREVTLETVEANFESGSWIAISHPIIRAIRRKIAAITSITSRQVPPLVYTAAATIHTTGQPSGIGTIAYRRGSDTCHDRTAESSLSGGGLSRHVSLCEAWRALPPS